MVVTQPRLWDRRGVCLIGTLGTRYDSLCFMGKRNERSADGYFISFAQPAELARFLSMREQSVFAQHMTKLSKRMSTGRQRRDRPAFRGRGCIILLYVSLRCGLEGERLMLSWFIVPTNRPHCDYGDNKPYWRQSPLGKE
jgi:hypothetical protein